MLSSLIQQRRERSQGTVEETDSIKSQNQTNPDYQGAKMRFSYSNGDSPLSGYTIKRGVGIGGFGEVYFALSDAGKEVALKRIQRNLDVEVRGVKQCINLRHANLVGLYDIRFDADEQGWIVMEYISGHNLRDYLDNKPQGIDRQPALEWFSQLAAGVAYLHDNGIVHRDLKPANVFLENDLVKIGDYGLSKFISCSRRGGQTESVGTFHYMAPEIGKGEYGKEIDIYALGIILYEILTGTVPFDGESTQEIILKHLTADPDLQKLPMDIRAVVATALAKNPTARFSDVREMLAPLGYEISGNGLAVPSKLVEPSIVTAEPVQELPGQSGRPVHEYHSQSAAASPSATSQNGTTTNSATSAPVITPFDAAFGPGHAHAATTQSASVPPTAPVQSPANTYYYREPIARGMQKIAHSIGESWNELNLSSGGKTALLIAIIAVLFFNSQFLIGMLFLGLIFYVPYYCIWFLFVPKSPAEPTFRSQPEYPAPLEPSTQSPTNSVRVQMAGGQAPVAKVQLAGKVAPPKRAITFSQWQVAHRRRVAQENKFERIHRLTESYVSSIGITVVLGSIAVLVVIASSNSIETSFLSACVWTLVMGLLSTWSISWLSRRWESRDEDRVMFRFKQLSCGLVLGTVGFLLSEFLLVPWGLLDQPSFFQELSPQYWNGFYTDSLAPRFPAFVSYFGLLFGINRWWRQSDFVRRRRFSFFSVIASIVLAGIVHCIIPFPQPWGILLAGLMAVTIQLSSPWLDSTDKNNLKQISLPQ